MNERESKQKLDAPRNRQYMDGCIIVLGKACNLENLDFVGEPSTIIAPNSFKARVIRWIARSRLFGSGENINANGDNIGTSSDGRFMRRRST